MLSHLGGRHGSFNCVVMEVGAYMVSWQVCGPQTSSSVSMTDCWRCVKEIEWWKKRMKRKTTWETSEALFYLVLRSRGSGGVTDSRGDSPVCSADCSVDWLFLSLTTSLTLRLFPHLSSSPYLHSPEDFCHHKWSTKKGGLDLEQTW